MATYKSINIAQAFAGFDTVIDVRSPAEYADDHFPDAISLPVLNNEERARIGTLFTQVSPFEAQKQGAALIARNIARHLEESLHDREKSWRPLIYCWRGGMRSGAMAHILAQVGWKTTQLTGGYKAYRRHVISALDTLPGQFHFVVIAGATGSGKSRLLHSLAQRGAQVLDLEALAQHRGSLLGTLPDQQQPAQKTFESRIFNVLRSFSTARPVYIEAESRKIGILNVPDTLLERMRTATCIAIEAPQDARVKLLLEDYEHFLHNPQLLGERLSLLLELHGHKVIDHWCELANGAEWQPLVAELLTRHYDPAYRRSSDISFRQLQHAETYQLTTLDSESLDRMAQDLINHERINDE
jgi:tRNA 2-selenouridine synthase